MLPLLETPHPIMRLIGLWKCKKTRLSWESVAAGGREGGRQGKREDWTAVSLQHRLAERSSCVNSLARLAWKGLNQRLNRAINGLFWYLIKRCLWPHLHVETKIPMHSSHAGSGGPISSGSDACRCRRELTQGEQKEIKSLWWCFI